jgi:hypothetical protein
MAFADQHHHPAPQSIASDVDADYELDWLGVPMFWSGFDPNRTSALLEKAGFTIYSSAIETAEEDEQPIPFFSVEARRANL